MGNLKGAGKIDEFAFILLAGIIFIFILVFVWSSPSEPAPFIEPRSIQKNVIRGSDYTFNLIINGTSEGKLSNVTLTPSGEIANWIDFDKDNFNIYDSESETVRVTVDVPSSAVYRTYKGNLKVSSKGGEAILTISINVVNKTGLQLKSEIIEFGDIDVTYSIGSEDLTTQYSLEVSKGTFGESTETMFPTINPERLDTVTSGYLDLVIKDTNRKENLIIYFNNQKIWEGNPSEGNLSIPIDKSLINTTNTIKMKTTSSWWKFWSKTVYKIESASFGIRYADTSEIETIFDLKREQVDNYDHFQLIARVKDHSSPFQKLMVRINNQFIYSHIPNMRMQDGILFIDQIFEQDLLGYDINLRTGTNEISLFLEKEGFYQLENVNLYVFYS